MVPTKSQQGTGLHGTECSYDDWQGYNQRERFCLPPKANSSRPLPAEPVGMQAALKMAVLLSAT